MLVGVTGLAQHGKDSIGRRLVDRWDYRRMAFADALKSMALALDPIIWPLDTEMGDDTVRLSELVGESGWDSVKTIPEVRRFLQVLGTEAVRDHLGADAWVRALERAWLEEGAPNTVVTDVRFPNEAEWIHRSGGALIHVVRPNFENGIGTDHPSERLIASLPADIEIVNDGDLADLDRQVDRVAADLAEGFMRRDGLVLEWDCD